MKQYTIKDFIKLNSPCIVCQSPIEIIQFESSVTRDKVPNKVEYVDQHIKFLINSNYRSKDYIYINLKNNYYHTEYGIDLDNFRFYLGVSCNNNGKKCSTISSSYLQFDSTRGIVLPISIEVERFDFTYGDDKMCLISNASYEKSSLYFNSDMGGKLIPKISIEKCKTKEKIIEKIQTYLTFE